MASVLWLRQSVRDLLSILALLASLLARLASVLSLRQSVRALLALLAALSSVGDTVATVP